MPIQAKGGKGIKGTIKIKSSFAEGLKDIGGFSHIILIYGFHRSKDYSLIVKPFLDDKLHGVFATRAPKRPNPIGISVVRLRRVEGRVLHIEDVDIHLWSRCARLQLSEPCNIIARAKVILKFLDLH